MQYYLNADGSIVGPLFAIDSFSSKNGGLYNGIQEFPC